MATTSLWPIHTAASRNSRAVVKQLVDYAENEEKTAKQGPVENGRNTNALQSVLGYISQEEKVGDPASAGASQKEPVQDPYMSDVIGNAHTCHILKKPVALPFTTIGKCSELSKGDFFIKVRKNIFLNSVNRFFFLAKHSLII